jgi:hypothetical protein
MEKQLQRIFELVALGRISPAEAQRWWAAWRDERVSGWMVMAAIAMASLATAHSLLAHPGAACTLEAIHRFLGGAV